MLIAMNGLPDGTEQLRALNMMGLAAEQMGPPAPSSGGGNSTVKAIESASAAAQALTTLWMGLKNPPKAAKPAPVVPQRSSGTNWTTWAMIGGGVLLIGGIGFVMLRGAGKKGK